MSYRLWKSKSHFCAAIIDVATVHRSIEYVFVDERQPFLQPNAQQKQVKIREKCQEPCQTHSSSTVSTLVFPWSRVVQGTKMCTIQLVGNLPSRYPDRSGQIRNVRLGWYVRLRSTVTMSRCKWPTQLLLSGQHNPERKCRICANQIKSGPYHLMKTQALCSPFQSITIK